ncbi:uncharacterized protein LOC123267378 [Cotesia glomerata]|uniref:EB domain-containing protein n=1 Tax=Cotesia glomerata TaxID=32391 RepID=A0AAV7HG39_COTGL|nr:uncharacterized protein LOC123267378 [Cotesia glomerata]KAH0535738.1 hypothetical protein KQX54_018656 [Cotesia glomerata]
MMITIKSFASLIFFGSLIVGVPFPPLNNIWEVDYKVPPLNAVKDLIEVVCNSTTSVCSEAINSSSALTGNSTVQFVNNTSNPKGLGDQCSLNKDCRDVFYSKCFNGTCSCQTNYTPVDGRCKGLIEEPCEEDSDCGVDGFTCRARVCRCQTGLQSSANHSLCFPLAEGLHKHCSNDQGCKTAFSNCSNGTCSCRDNYATHDGVCYGLPGAQCHLSKDCVSVPYSCKSGTCQLAIYELNGKHILSKPEVPSFIEVWNPIKEKVRDGVQIKVSPNGLPLYLTRSNLSDVFWIIKGPSKWRKSGYTLDEAIPRIDLVVGNLNLYCRIKHDQDRQYGRLEPPYYDKCIVGIGNDVTVYDSFEALVGE